MIAKKNRKIIADNECILLNMSNDLSISTEDWKKLYDIQAQINILIFNHHPNNLQQEKGFNKKCKLLQHKFNKLVTFILLSK